MVQQATPTNILSAGQNSFIQSLPHWTTGLTHSLTDIANTTSDHAPLFLVIKPTTYASRRAFHFVTYWLHYNDIQPLVATACESIAANPTITVLKKLATTRRALTAWAGNKFRDRNNNLTRTKC
jgi:hypothetical protein